MQNRWPEQKRTTIRLADQYKTVEWCFVFSTQAYTDRCAELCIVMGRPRIQCRERSPVVTCYNTLVTIYRRRRVTQFIARQTNGTKIHRNSIRKVKYTSICLAHFYAKRLKCAQTWITQFYLQITPCMPLLPSRRTSPPFGWYSFYRPTEGRRLSRPGWLVTYRNKVPPPGVEPDTVTHPSTNRAQRRLTSLI